jgi:hypothetical protein
VPDGWTRSCAIGSLTATGRLLDRIGVSQQEAPTLPSPCEGEGRVGA